MESSRKGNGTSQGTVGWGDPETHWLMFQSSIAYNQELGVATWPLRASVSLSVRRLFVGSSSESSNESIDAEHREQCLTFAHSVPTICWEL